MGFTYSITKDSRVLISWEGRQVVILKGRKAEKFITVAGKSDEKGQQLLMARFTGNFKRGNER